MEPHEMLGAIGVIGVWLVLCAPLIALLLEYIFDRPVQAPLEPKDFLLRPCLPSGGKVEDEKYDR